MKQNIKNMLLQIFEAGVAAVKPDEALLRHLQSQNGVLTVAGCKYNLNRGQLRVVGAGKGAAPLAHALDNLPGLNIAEGLIVVKEGHALPLGKIGVIEASHPQPDERGLAGAEKMLAIVQKCAPGDILLVLLTGGASSLLPAPAHGLSLSELKATTGLLLACGATIDEINAIRKHLSLVGGGKLARAANGAFVIGVIVSDVVGDDLSVIASGPTAPDASTYTDCLRIIEKYGLWEKIPGRALRILHEGAAGKIAETPRAGEECFANTQNVIVASNSQALDAAAKTARELGLEVERMSTPMTGYARDMTNSLLAEAQRIAANQKVGDPNCCLLAGGETTVILRGKGKGGRNQQMALVAALELAGDKRVNCLFAGTDGTDGPTDAAGGFACGDSVDRMGGMEKAKQELFADNSYFALQASGDLLKTGPTLTNVMDIAIIIVEAPQ